MSEEINKVLKIGNALQNDFAFGRSIQEGDMNWYFSESLGAIESQAESIQELVNILKVAKCPDPSCDGNGVTTVLVEGTEVGCCGQPLGNGECCGNAVPVPTQEQEQAPCQWCYAKESLIDQHGAEVTGK